MREVSAKCKPRFLSARRLFRPQLLAAECISVVGSEQISLKGEFIASADSVLLGIRVLWPLLRRVSDRRLEARLLTRMRQLLPSDGTMKIEEFSGWRASRIRVHLPAEHSIRAGYFLVEIGQPGHTRPIGRMEFLAREVTS